MKILVTGGGGFIGSAVVKKLIQKNHAVTVLDSLERGHRHLVDPKACFIKGSLLDKTLVKKILQHNFDGIVHCAGYISVGESAKKPSMYMKNNIQSLLNIVENLPFGSKGNIIFSSSAAVYGNTAKNPIPETAPLHPTSPYGESKLAAEKILLSEKKIKSVSLRYFNASGAMPDLNCGELHRPETHLIPKAIDCALKNKAFYLFGDNYDTADGSCVRDYIHVSDLADAHVLALEALWQNKNLSRAYNVGSGEGHSNKEVIKKVENVTGRRLKIKIKERRVGDPKILIADISKIKKELDFTPRLSKLSKIIESAYKWYIQQSRVAKKQ